MPTIRVEKTWSFTNAWKIVYALVGAEQAPLAHSTMRSETKSSLGEFNNINAVKFSIREARFL